MVVDGEQRRRRERDGQAVERPEQVLRVDRGMVGRAAGGDHDAGDRPLGNGGGISSMAARWPSSSRGATSGCSPISSRRLTRVSIPSDRRCSAAPLSSRPAAPLTARSRWSSARPTLGGVPGAPVARCTLGARAVLGARVVPSRLPLCTRRSSRLSLYRAREALHEVPLEQHEEQEDRQDGHGHTRRDCPEVGAEDALERDQADRQRHATLGVEHQRGPQEVVPGRHEREDRDRGQGRPDDRKEDAPPDAQLARAIDAGGVDEFRWHPPERLSQQEDVERADQVRQDQGGSQS